MSDATLSAGADGYWELAGPLDFATVPDVWPALEQALCKGSGVTLSLAGVDRSNSAALAMLVEARDIARRRGCPLRLVEVPRELLDLASMSQCEDLLLSDAA